MSGHVCGDQVFPVEAFIHRHSFVRVRGRAVTFVFPSWEWTEDEISTLSQYKPVFFPRESEGWNIYSSCTVNDNMNLFHGYSITITFNG